MFPSMTGGWGGTWAAVTTLHLPEGPVTRSASCAMTWLVNSQTDGAFAERIRRLGNSAPMRAL